MNVYQCFEGLMMSLIQWAAVRKVALGLLVASAGVSPCFAQRFIIQGDEVIDRTSGLAWRRCSEGQVWDGQTCSGTVLRMSWAAALEHARAAASQGVAWRMPSVKELASLVDYQYLRPAIAPEFPNTPPSNYWTSTPYVLRNYVWTVRFALGDLVAHPYPTSPYVLRLVRDAN